MQKIKTFDSFFWISLSIFLFIVGIICFFPIWFTSYSSKFNFTNTGPIGDTIGGTMGPFIAIAAAILTFLAFWVQYKANEQQKEDLRDQKHRADIDGFENTFFEMVKLHRDNVNEQKYSKFNDSFLNTYENREVLRTIFQEFIECYREVKKFSNSEDPKTYLKPNYREKLEKIKIRNKVRASLIELAIMDIAYSIVFFGVEIEGETVLHDRFRKRYNDAYFYRVLTFIKLKPKNENKVQGIIWKYVREMKLPKFSILIEQLYVNRKETNLPNNLPGMTRKILLSEGFSKYYSGHQQRLGHYFRHLFQAYKFLNKNSFLDEQQKYFYGKTLRAQLSTYEQALLFVNSISSLGMRWEYDIRDIEPIENNGEMGVGLITKYHLIKNLPGKHLLGLKYKEYYPKVDYENNEK